MNEKNTSPIVTDADNTSVQSGKKHGNLLPKILSVAAAVILWLYVFQAVEYEKVFMDVPIKIENFNTSLDIDIVSGYDQTIDLTLSGTKSVINDVNADDITVSVDMTNVTDRGTHVVDINVDAPNGAKIVDMSLRQLKVTIDKTVEKEIEITPVINYNIQYPYEMGEPQLSQTVARLKGPETDINSVKSALLLLNLGNIKNTIDSSAPIVLYDENDYELSSQYIIVDPSNVSVNIPVYKTQIFDVLPDISYDDSKFEISVEPSSVYLKGLVNDVEALSSLKTEKKTVNAVGEYELSLLLPGDVTASTERILTDGSEISSVKLIVTEKKQKEPNNTKENE